jgi:hypothetical protein
MTEQRLAENQVWDLLYLSTRTVPQGGWRRYWKLLRALDVLADCAAMPGRRRALEAARSGPARNVLVVGVEVPGREADLQHVSRRIMAGTHHRVTLSTVPMKPQGKFDNINEALQGSDLQHYEWLLVIDDDVSIPDDFLDLILQFATRHDLKLAQPAHCYRSYSTYAVTERRMGSLVRQTAFVEIGPVTLLHRDTFAELLPFPSLRWAWGLDFLWADIAKRHGWRIGVIDAVPVQHLRPVAKTYSDQAARQEGFDFLKSRGLGMTRDDMLGLGHKLS